MAIKQQEVSDRGKVAVVERPEAAAEVRTAVDLKVASREKRLLGISWALLLMAFIAIPALEAWKFATSFLLFAGMVVVLFILFQRFRPQG